MSRPLDATRRVGLPARCAGALLLGLALAAACTGPNELERILSGAPLICERYKDKLLSCCARFDAAAAAGQGYVPQLCLDVRAVAASLGDEDWSTCPLESARNDEFLPCETINFDSRLQDPAYPGATRAIASHAVTIELAELAGPAPSDLRQLVARVRVVPLGRQPDLVVLEGGSRCEVNHYRLGAEPPDLPPIAGNAGTIQISVPGSERNGFSSPLQCRRGLFASLEDRWAYFCDAPAKLPDRLFGLEPHERETSVRGINEDTTGFGVVAVGAFQVAYELPPRDEPSVAPFEAVFPAELPSSGRDLPIEARCLGQPCSALRLRVRSSDQALDERTAASEFVEVDCVARPGAATLSVPAAVMAEVTAIPWKVISVQLWESPELHTADDRGTDIVYAAGLGAYTQYSRTVGPQ